MEPSPLLQPAPVTEQAPPREPAPERFKSSIHRIDALHAGILQVQITSGEKSLLKHSRIKVQILGYRSGNNPDENAKVLKYRRYSLGGDLFINAPVLGGHRYQVSVESPEKLLQPLITLAIFKRLDDKPLVFKSTGYGRGKLLLKLPADVYVETLGRNRYLLRGTAVESLETEFAGGLNLDAIKASYDPFHGQVVLRFPECANSWRFAQDRFERTVPRDFSLIHSLKVERDVIELGYTGTIKLTKQIDGNICRIGFQKAGLLMEKTGFKSDKGLIRQISWDFSKGRLTLTVLSRTSGRVLTMGATYPGTGKLRLRFKAVSKPAPPPGASDSTQPAYSRGSVVGEKGFEKKNFYNPGDIAVDSRGTIYVVDTYNHQVKSYRVKPWLSEVVLGGYGTGAGKLNKPSSIAVGKDNRLYVADMMNNRVQVFDQRGSFVRGWGDYGRTVGKLANPLAIETDGDGRVFVADMNHRITIFTPEGRYLQSWGRAGKAPGEFSNPSALAYDRGTGKLYVADRGNRRIQVLKNGVLVGRADKIANLARSGFTPSGIAVRGNRLYITDAAYNRLIVVDKHSFALKAAFGKRGSKSGQFDSPMGLAVSDQAWIVIADRYNNRIQFVNETHAK